VTTHRLSLARDIAEVARLVDWVTTCCAGAGLGGDFATRLSLALDEAVSNVIRHAFEGAPPPHRIEVWLEADAAGAAATVIDNGKPFDPTAAPMPETSLPVAEREPGGLGVLLLRAMVDRVIYSRVDGENRLRLEKSRIGKAP
jgi:anti-sigma regulatory factor (Ser/Thr protein kinase)